MNAASPASTHHTTQGTHPAGLHCLSCHYELTNVPFGPCPECGTLHDATAARYAKLHRRWIIRVLATGPTEVLFAGVGILALIIGFAAASPFLILLGAANFLPFISLASGVSAFAICLPRHHRPLHRAVWMRTHRHLWAPAWIWIPLLICCYFVAMVMPTVPDRSMLWVGVISILCSIGISWPTWRAWNRRMLRLADKLHARPPLWDPSVNWLPILIILLAALVGTLPGLLLIVVDLHFGPATP